MSITKTINLHRMLAFDFNDAEKLTTLTFTGRMDTLAVARLNEMLEAEPRMKEWRADQKIVFDLANVEYMASSFIRICVSYAKQASPGQFSMVNCQPFVKKTFKISGLDEVLNIS
jgi:anti-anti-sigma factor